MKQNNLISIIVPVYNREDRIKKCIDALLHQTYKNIEIVCVNDGSTDNSLNILYDYQKKDARVKIWVLPILGMLDFRLHLGNTLCGATVTIGLKKICVKNFFVH